MRARLTADALAWGVWVAAAVALILRARRIKRLTASAELPPPQPPPPPPAPPTQVKVPTEQQGEDERLLQALGPRLKRRSGRESRERRTASEGPPPSGLTTTPITKALGLPRTRSFTTTAADRKLMQVAPFSPAIAHWELAQREPGEVHLPSAWELDAALLFVDISGFTNLCTRLDIDTLQRHINCYFGELIDVVTDFGGDVLRFAGDALYCAWSLPSGAAADGTLGLATRAACRCALELTRRCGTYPIPEADSTLSIHSGIGAGEITAYRVGANARWEFLIAGKRERKPGSKTLQSNLHCRRVSLLRRV